MVRVHDEAEYSGSHDVIYLKVTNSLGQQRRGDAQIAQIFPVDLCGVCE